jgi:putative Holliday junction resolvase
MSRIMAFDYGSKRVGVAVTDPLQMIAHGLTTVKSSEVFAFIKTYLKTEKVECFVVGEPLQNDNSPSSSSGLIKNFVKSLQKQFPAISVQMVDERFTSKLASMAILSSGIKKMDRQNKALVDEVSATIILQTYLESEKYKKNF